MTNLFPRTIFHLLTQQILDAASDTESVAHARRHESHDGPGRLRRRAVPLPAPCRVAVRQTRFAPPAIGILLRLKPGNRAANIGLRKILLDRTETCEDGPGAVDIVDAPPTVPAAVGLLLSFEESKGRPHSWVGPIVAQRRKHLETASGQIGCARIKLGMVIGKGDVI